MLKEERHRLIRKRVESDGTASVSDLAEQFGVSEMTIRRDLEQLLAQGQIVRVHGGAVAPDRRQMVSEPPMLERVREQSGAKRRIGLSVAGMIKRGETVFIGSGTTTLALAKALRDRQDITVVTNALTIANTLANSPGINLLVIGGFLRRSELSLIGHVAESALEDLRVDKVIMGMRGVHPEYGLTSDHHQELMTDRAIMAISDHIIVLADHTKFGHIAASRTAPATAANLIVTDERASKEIVDQIRILGIEVIQV